MILTDESGKMEFNFTGFISADYFDIQDNKCAGLKLVDFVAENDENQIFIEVKNYLNFSDDEKIQIAMDKRRKTDYLKLTDWFSAFPLEIGMTFKDSLFRWLASGNEFKKPVVLLLVINPPTELKSRERRHLLNKINGYIPSGMNNKLEKYPKMSPVFFDMPYIADIPKRYGFKVSVTS